MSAYGIISSVPVPKDSQRFQPPTFPPNQVSGQYWKSVSLRAAKHASSADSVTIIRDYTVGHRQGRTAPYQHCRLERLQLQPLTLGESVWETDFRKFLVAPLEKLKLTVTAASPRKLRGTAVQVARRRTVTTFVDQELEGQTAGPIAV
jgi:hypothetical protein